MSKATQKGGLLAELAYLDQAEYIDKQACVQLVKIVEQHFSEPKKAAVKLMAVNTVVKMINAMPEEERTELKAKMFPDTQAEQSGEVGEELITDLKIFENYCKDCIPEWYEKIKRARLLLQQKRVTREWIEKELNAHLRVRLVSIRLEDEALRDYVHVIADIIVEIFTEFGIEVVEEQDQPPMDKETAGDMKYHELKDEGRLDRFGRRKK